MTGRELFNALQVMDSNELKYVVLIGVEDRWVKLETVKIDFEMKSIDLGGEKS